jgi:3',5'-cyclic AMP phosphodiesterase CpdA
MTWTLGLVTDIHFGPEARFEGKLRKLSHRAPQLLDDAVRALDAHDPLWLINLGDDIEDEDPAIDRARYLDCQAALRRSRAPLVNVAGNHDLARLTPGDLLEAWGQQGPLDPPGSRGPRGSLHYSLDRAGLHLVVLQTREIKDQGVHIDEELLRWLAADLAAASGPVVVVMHHPAADQDLRDSRWFHAAPHLALIEERAALRAILRESGKVRAVFNGHVHRNHLGLHDGIPYVTVQSLIENLDDDAPGLPSASYAVVHIDEERVVVRVLGNDRAAYQIER